MPRPGAEAVTPPPNTLQYTRRDLLAGGCGVLGGLGIAALTRVTTGGAAEPPLRPPGALTEDEFRAACIRCGQCVQVCPFDTLDLLGLGSGFNAGTPTLDPNIIPCELCSGEDGLLCIEVCPTDALAPLESDREINIGDAVINEDLCYAYNGVICRSCWHACPYPNEAIVLNDVLRPEVDTAICIGCGLCVIACPVEPKAILVEPTIEGNRT